MATCKDPDCNREIVWGIDEKGTRVPLDPSAPVYEILRFDPIANAYAVHRDGGDRPKHYVSHFKTCPASNKFGKGKTRTPPDHKASAAGD